MIFCVYVSMTMYILVLDSSGVGVGNGCDLSCKIITDKFVFEMDFGNDHNCKVGLT